MVNHWCILKIKKVIKWILAVHHWEYQPQTNIDRFNWLCLLVLTKLSKLLIILLHIPFWRSLKTGPSCQTFSKALVSRNIPQTLSPISTVLQGKLSSLGKFLATESLLKMMTNDFYIIWKALLVLKILKFLSWIFSPVK